MRLTSIPAADGFRMPAEWAPHERCWMIWPQRPDNWRLGAEPAQQAFATVAAAISRYEPVTMLVSDEQYDRARRLLPPGVDLLRAPTDDAWMRDVSPTFVVDGAGGLRGVDWIFNAWGGLTGGLYAPWDNDDAVAGVVCGHLGCDSYRTGFVLEGGAIDTDGEGTLLTTAECVLNPNRNPGMTAQQFEANVRDYLGIERVIWLPRGVHLDETDGHVDNFARFAAPGVVMLTWTQDRDDPQWQISSEALRILRQSRDARGRALQVELLHQPGPITITAQEAAGVQHVPGTQPRDAGMRLAGSYVNSYIGNGVVVLPVFGDPHDDAAIAAYRRLFPEREVVPVDSREILLGGGNVHCITAQQPRP